MRTSIVCIRSEVALEIAVKLNFIENCDNIVKEINDLSKMINALRSKIITDLK